MEREIYTTEIGEAKNASFNNLNGQLQWTGRLQKNDVWNMVK